MKKAEVTEHAKTTEFGRQETAARKLGESLTRTSMQIRNRDMAVLFTRIIYTKLLREAI